MPEVLCWANQAYETEEQEETVFLWDNGEIKEPPRFTCRLKSRPFAQIKHLQASPVDRPADITKLLKKLFSTRTKRRPARLIVESLKILNRGIFSLFKETGVRNQSKFPQNEWLGKPTSSWLPGWLESVLWFLFYLRLLF